MNERYYVLRQYSPLQQPSTQQNFTLSSSKYTISLYAPSTPFRVYFIPLYVWPIPPPSLPLLFWVKPFLINKQIDEWYLIELPNLPFQPHLLRGRPWYAEQRAATWTLQLHKRLPAIFSSEIICGIHLAEYWCQHRRQYSNTVFHRPNSKIIVAIEHSQWKLMKLTKKIRSLWSEKMAMPILYEFFTR